MKYYFHDDKFAYVAMETDGADFATSDSLEKDIKIGTWIYLVKIPSNFINAPLVFIKMNFRAQE